MKAVKYQEQNHIIKIQLKGDYCKQHERYKTGKFAINTTINLKTALCQEWGVKSSITLRDSKLNKLFKVVDFFYL